jgi:hypothetical protein
MQRKAHPLGAGRTVKVKQVHTLKPFNNWTCRIADNRHLHTSLASIFVLFRIISPQVNYFLLIGI